MFLQQKMYVTKKVMASTILMIVLFGAVTTEARCRNPKCKKAIQIQKCDQTLEQMLRISCLSETAKLPIRSTISAFINKEKRMVLRTALVCGHRRCIITICKICKTEGYTVPCFAPKKKTSR